MILLNGIAGRDFVGLNDGTAGFREEGVTAMDIAVGLDFNLRFVGKVARSYISYPNRSCIHSLAWALARARGWA